MNFPDPVQAIIAAFICNEPLEYFSPKVIKLFQEMYHCKVDEKGITIGACRIGPDYVSIKYAGVKYSRGRELSVMIHDMKPISWTLGEIRTINFPTQDQVPKLPATILTKLDPSGEFGLCKIFEPIVGDRVASQADFHAMYITGHRRLQFPNFIMCFCKKHTPSSASC